MKAQQTSIENNHNFTLLSSSTLKGKTVSNCRFTDIEVRDSEFKDVIFDSCHFSKVRFVNCVFDGVQFNFCDLKDLFYFEGCTFRNSFINGTRADTITFLGACEFNEGLKITDATIEMHMAFNQNADKSGSVSIVDCTIGRLSYDSKIPNLTYLKDTNVACVALHKSILCEVQARNTLRFSNCIVKNTSYGCTLKTATQYGVNFIADDIGIYTRESFINWTEVDKNDPIRELFGK